MLRKATVINDFISFKFFFISNDVNIGQVFWITRVDFVNSTKEKTDESCKVRLKGIFSTVCRIVNLAPNYSSFIVKIILLNYHRNIEEMHGIPTLILSRYQQRQFSRLKVQKVPSWHQWLSPFVFPNHRIQLNWTTRLTLYMLKSILRLLWSWSNSLTKRSFPKLEAAKRSEAETAVVAVVCA